MLKDNLGLRILSLVLAMLIWLQSVLISEHRSTVNLPVQLRFVPKNITLENIPDTIPFSVKGKGMDILKLMLAKPQVQIDASKITPSTDILSLNNYTIDLPDNINVSLIGPAQSDQLAIQADVFHQKSVGIKLSFADDYTKNQFAELQYTISPEKLTIFGPKSRIQAISQISTKPISRNMMSESRLTIELDMPDNEISVSENKVLISIIHSRESTKVFSDIPLAARFLPSLIAVRIKAPASILDKIKPSDIIPEISETADAEGLYTVNIILPPEVELLAVTPNKVRARP